MAYDNVRGGYFSVLSSLRRHCASVAALLAVAALAGCPPRVPTRDEILSEAKWTILFLEDGEGGIPPDSHLAWEWLFSVPARTVSWFQFPGFELTSVLAYEWQGEELVIDGPATVSHFEDRERVESEFDSLRPGDVFGHMKVSLRLTGRSQSRFREYTMAGSYVFTFSEEWGGEVFSGTFEGLQSLPE